jgi:hypothetical protein
MLLSQEDGIKQHLGVCECKVEKNSKNGNKKYAQECPSAPRWEQGCIQMIERLASRMVFDNDDEWWKQRTFFVHESYVSWKRNREKERNKKAIGPLLARRVSAKSPAQSPQSTTKTTTVLVRHRRAIWRNRSSAVLAAVDRLHIINSISSTTTSNVIDGSLGPRIHEFLIMGKFLVKGEDGSLAVPAAESVAGPTASGSKFLCWWWWW